MLQKILSQLSNLSITELRILNKEVVNLVRSQEVSIKNRFFLGDIVSFIHSGSTQYAIVVKKNPKTLKVITLDKFMEFNISSLLVKKEHTPPNWAQKAKEKIYRDQHEIAEEIADLLRHNIN